MKIIASETIIIVFNLISKEFEEEKSFCFRIIQDRKEN